MRIAFVTTEYPTEDGQFDGGLANYLQRAGLALAELGHHPIIVIPADEDRIIHDRGIEIHRVRMPRWTSYDMFNRATFYRLHMLAWCLRFSRNLVRHIHRVNRQKTVDIIQYPHLHALGLLRSSSIPSVCRLSGWGPLWRHHGDGSMSLTQVHQQFLLERLALHRADAIYGPSHSIAKYVEAAIHRKVSVIENPFVLDTVVCDHKLWQQRLAGRRYLLFVGQLLRMKGLITISEVIKPLLERFPDLYLVFAGKESALVNKDDTIESMMMRQAGEHGNRILFLGKLRHQELYPILANAHAVWLPSLVDNLPNACLEAMAHGRVVIGTRGASFEQLIDDGVNGLLCEPGDALGLMKAAVRALAMSEEDRRAIGEKARLRIDRMHPRHSCAILLHYYRTIIDQHRQRHAR